MKNFNEAMNAYQEIGIWLQPSSNCVDRMKEMKDRPVKTGVGKRIIIFYAFLATVLLCVVPVTVYAATYVSKELYDKLKNAGLSYEEMSEIQENLQGWGFTQEEILVLGELSKNEDGLTYGPDALGADLIAVISDQGEKGYIYRSDYDAADAKTLEEALDGRKEAIVIKVYQSDGKTQIGTFTLSDGKSGE